MQCDVLIVDDSRAMRSFIRRALSMTSIVIGATHEAENGLEGLRVLERHRVQLIFSDINMPVMDGVAFVGELAKCPEKSKIPVVVVSTNSSEKRRAQMQSLGAKGYIAKPFSPEAIDREINRLLCEADDEA